MALALTVICPVGLGDVVTYEANESPVDDGWEITGEYCSPELSIGAGQFCQHVALCPGDDPPGGQFIAYSRSLADFDGAPTFFAEWRVRSDAPRTELFPWGGGAAVGLSGFGGVYYNAYIVSDRVWLRRHALLPFVFVDLQPSRPHTFRIELEGADRYTWLIDGAIVATGTPVGPYPSATPMFVWQGYAAWQSSTVCWDYIRYGDLKPRLAGDVNCDGQLDHFDIDPFVLALVDAPAYSAAYPDCPLSNRDIDADGALTNFDIDPFVTLLLAQP
ncbi:MAG: hypothetical protein IPM64_02400 [Phycisphaerales bacterium]|nr:hypothetical protein [Phycisphaerales bacterium]